MANFTQQDGFNTGIQRQVTIIDNDTGLPIDLGGDLISFKSDPKVVKIEIKPIDSTYNKFKRSYDGWGGSFVVARVNGNLDAFQAANESNYHNRLPQKYYTINEETRNDDGSIDSYQYMGCTVDLQTSGDWKKDASVDVTIEFEAQTRV